MASQVKGKVPKIVALEVLEKNGVNVERLKELITKGVGAEFTAYYYYTILRMHCTWFRRRRNKRDRRRRSY